MFAVTTDHARQEQVGEALQRSYSQEPYQIRRLLTERTIRASDKRVLFVGLEAYEAAGGGVMRDLFQQDDGGWLQDPALLDRLIALALERSAGTEVSFGEDEVLEVRDLDTFDFKGVDIGLFSPGAKVSAVYAPRAAAAGCVVIDNTSQFRMDPDVPLVVPEVNPEAIAGYTKRNIIANPNCSTIQMVVALKPLHDLAKIKRVVVATYQSVSGAGKEAMDELFNQTRAIYMNRQSLPETFTKQIAFNVIPHIDAFLEDGATKEEWKMAVETKKIVDPAIEVMATCVRVPVFIGHAEAVNLEFERPITVDEARAALRKAPGLSVVDHRADEGQAHRGAQQRQDPACSRRDVDVAQQLEPAGTAISRQISKSRFPLNLAVCRS